MTPQDLIAAFDTLAEAPGGVARLRELVLQLAVRGRLVPQDLNDEPAGELLERIAAEKARAIHAGEAPRPRATAEAQSECETPFDLPRRWQWALLDRLCVYIQRGKSPKYDDASYVRVVSQKCVQWTGFDLSRARGVCEDGLGKYGSERFLRAGDLLWNSTGTGTVGRINTFLCSPKGARVVADSHVTVVRPALAHPGYLWCWLAGPAIQHRIADLTTGTTKQQELGTGTVRALSVPLPPLAEQRRIVARVDELMGLLDRLEAARNAREATRIALRDAALSALREADTTEEVEIAWNRIAERMDDLFNDPADVKPLRQTVLQLAARGRLVPQDPDDEPASVLLERIAVEKARLVAEGKIRKPKEMPQVAEKEVPFEVAGGWEWIRFGLTHVNRDAERVPVSRAQRSGREGQYDYYGASGVIDQIDEFLFDGTFLLIGEDGANLVLRSTPIAFLARGRFWVNNHAHVLHSVEEASLKFLSIYVNSIDLSPYVTGTAQPKLNQAKMNSIPCAFPPLAEQERIVARVDELMGLLDRLENHLANKTSTHDAFAAAAVHNLEG